LIFHLTVTLIQYSGFVVAVYRLIPIGKKLKFLQEIFRCHKFSHSEKILQAAFACGHWHWPAAVLVGTVATDELNDPKLRTPLKINR